MTSFMAWPRLFHEPCLLAVGEVTAAVVATPAQQVLAHRRLDQHGEVAYRVDVERHLGHLDAENVVLAEHAGQSVDRLALAGCVDQVDDQAEVLGALDRVVTVHHAHVEDAEPAHLEEVAEWLRAGAHHQVGGDAGELGSVVGDQAVAARNQVECQLALADAARPGQQDADAEYLDEDAVQRQPGRQQVEQFEAQAVDQVVAGQRRGHQRDAGALGRVGDGVGRRQAVAHHHQHRCSGEQPFEHVAVGFGCQGVEVVHLGRAEDLHRARVDQVEVVDQQRAQLGVVTAGDGPKAAGPARRPRQLEARAERVEQVVDGRPLGHAVAWLGLHAVSRS
jgi:hypothetical protein